MFKLRQTMVDSCYCSDRIVPEGMSQVSRRSEVGNHKRRTVLRWAVLSNGYIQKLKKRYFVHFLTLCIKSNFFIPSNIEKSLHRIPREGALCIVVQFSRVEQQSYQTISYEVIKAISINEYNFCLYRFLSFQTSPVHFDLVTAPTKSC